MPTATPPSGDGREPFRSAWVLLNAHAHIGDKSNNTTAQGTTSKNMLIYVSFFPERPPLPSNLYVHCPNAVFGRTPRILCIVDDLILFRVVFVWQCYSSSIEQSEHFIYRADPKRPSLELLPRPRNVMFRDDDVGILPRGDDHYIIAALFSVPAAVNEFLLHLFDSKSKIWSSKMLSVESPQENIPINIPASMHQLFYHRTVTVITLGGKGGTIGWVDLWRGILFCDVLEQKHTLRGVPVPLPMNHINSKDEMFKALGHSRSSRGIAFINGYLKFVELQYDFTLHPGYDSETGWPSYQIHNWKITTWNNSKMSDLYNDWHQDCSVQASDFAISNQMMNLESELEPLQDSTEAAIDRRNLQLQNLFVSDPTLCVDGDDVVYLTAREKVLHPKSWVFALDLRKQAVQAVVKSGPQPEDAPLHIHIIYCPCSISKCMNPATAPVPGGT